MRDLPGGNIPMIGQGVVVDASGQETYRILLIQAVDYDTRTLVGFQPLCTPLSIATIAALTPSGFAVDLWDENLDGLIDADSVLPHPHYDIVGISTLFEHVGHRVPELARLFRSRGAHTCAGGPGISNQVELISASVDSVFLNEAEYTWPRFLQDWRAGQAQREYVQVAKPDLAASPAPRWDAIRARVPEYRAGGVQTTRGCPFDCEFCDVIYLYGRAQRHKPVANVLAEVAALQRLGAQRVFFTDDEFVGDPRYCGALLEELVRLNNSFPAPLAYHTQLTLNLSRQPQLLQLMADANFWHALIGIESFDEAALRETNKLQNCNRDIVADCRRILSYGVGINGSLIVGFDHDGPDVFERIVRGVQQACIPFASVSILRATHGTRLWTRMREEKRLWRLRDAARFPQALQMDILPAGALSRREIIEGRIWVNRELSRVTHLCARLNGWLELLQRVPDVHDPRTLGLDAARQLLRGHQALSLSPAEVKLLEETLEHTSRKAPLMMGRIVDAVLAQLYWYRIRTFHTPEDLAAVIAAEKAGDLVADTKPVLLPTSFAHAFRRHLFAVVYERLARSLTDSRLIPEIASDVFVDFVVRIRDDPGPLTDELLCAPRYEEFLRQLCDRAIAQVTAGSAAAAAVTRESGPISMRGVRKSGLYDAVLKEVGDRLSKLNAA